MFSSAEITELLIDWSNGDQTALDRLFPLVERELHRIAHNYMRSMKPGNTLQTTAVINETYLRMVKQNDVQWQNRAHFFGIAAKIMRRFLLNYLRQNQFQKRGGGGLVKVEFEDAPIIAHAKSDEILALEEALLRLEKIDERKANVVELRFYGGLSISETAVALNVSENTVSRDWNMAKAWLAREIRNDV